MNIALYIFRALVLFIPAFIANSGAVITGGKWKIDMGHNFIDGRRILGNGKTWSGYFGGSLIGVFAGIVIYGISIATGGFIGTYGNSLISVASAIIPMSFGSLTGDIIGSFTKRRIGIESGGKGSLLDQWPFALTAFLFLYVFDPHFFIEYYFYIGMISILIITPPLHRAVNIIGYKMHKKDVPW
ncbi:MAG: CDP-2,3-bis-(O-geranylgeranyl)-sn-glycerol synthase [Thermoplasmata archaeon]